MIKNQNMHNLTDSLKAGAEGLIGVSASAALYAAPRIMIPHPFLSEIQFYMQFCFTAMSVVVITFTFLLMLPKIRRFIRDLKEQKNDK